MERGSEGARERGSEGARERRRLGASWGAGSGFGSISMLWLVSAEAAREEKANHPFDPVPTN
eukprot:9662515-Heterocapsa_arctica.AAC.1